ncbi:tail fiber assembly protein [Citrobacter koseri]|uniref:tail fiber assembly protein n=2 Tax=Citrobacter koseri TaxID=545 RepID=UPI000DF0F945|nr:tail fiber assembly protein [Citrobacter koseri]MBJ9819326.1 tail fiber assembly protein [Citrobacter koseri]STA77361.1 phage tail fiber assembly protein [Citrobacter koseri]STB37597.1 phage tail fiber assembly protein [Citrobacter koseri]STT22314.1 phage tail fiber assembly protein [Citrobacter koseri]
MQHLKNLKKYTPDDEDSLFLMNEHGAEFFISDDGRDWYKSQSDFLPNTLKVAYDEAGIIRCISNDVSTIYPRDFSIVEVKTTSKNKMADISGEWVFKDGKIQPRQYSQNELIEQAETKKAELLSAAAAAIAPLQDAVDIGMATNEETALLLEWKKYRVQVNRVDTSTAPGIEWPEQPK